MDNAKAQQLAKFRRWLDEAKALEDRAQVMWLTKWLRTFARINLNTN